MLTGTMPARVKICGIRTAETMAAAIDADASMVGLVFYPRSPRNVSLETAAELAAMARGRATIVALLVDPDDGLMAEVVARVKPDLIQLHGSEAPQRVAEIRSRFGLPVMKAIKVETAEDARGATEFAGAADLILFDAKAPKDLANALPGGNGLAFDWSVLSGVTNRMPFVLSGGLTVDNVAAAVAATGARTVDVSSGVEIAPGVKSPELIRRFVAAARAA